MYKEEDKIRYIKSLVESRGLFAIACTKTGISDETIRRWRRDDEEFARKVDAVLAMQCDMVENELLTAIKSGDVNAMKYYLDHKGGRNGYGRPSQNVTPTVTAEVIPTVEATDATNDMLIAKKIKAKKARLVKLLKAEGKYSEDLIMQIEITAELQVKKDMLSEEILTEKHQAVSIQYSREGNEREVVSAKERLYLDYTARVQLALKALGMNTDAKERKVEDDGFSDFMNAFKD